MYGNQEDDDEEPTQDLKNEYKQTARHAEQQKLLIKEQRRE